MFWNILDNQKQSIMAISNLVKFAVSTICIFERPKFLLRCTILWKLWKITLKSLLKKNSWNQRFHKKLPKVDLTIYFLRIFFSIFQTVSKLLYFGNYGKLLSNLFWKNNSWKQRFHKKITKKLIWRNIFSMKIFFHFSTLWFTYLFDVNEGGEGSKTSLWWSGDPWPGKTPSAYFNTFLMVSLPLM